MYFNKKEMQPDHAVNLSWCSRCMQQPIQFSSQLCENHIGAQFNALSVSPISDDSKLTFDLLSKFDVDADLCFDTLPEQKEDIKTTAVEISDLAYTEDDHLILCSSGSRILQSRRVRAQEHRRSQKLLKYSEKGKFVGQCILEAPPRKLCLLSQEEAVVTLGQKIQFVTITDMSPGRSMIIGSECSGITLDNNTIYVGDSTKLHVLDRIGRMLRTIELRCSPYGLHSHIDGRLYCTTGKYLCCITKDGTQIYSYNSSELGPANGITSDKAGNIYVAGSELQMFYSSKPQIERVLGKDDGLGTIKAICFNNAFSKMFMANNDGQTISIYTCK